jgi:hypothetical protein
LLEIFFSFISASGRVTVAIGMSPLWIRISVEFCNWVI